MYKIKSEANRQGKRVVVEAEFDTKAEAKEFMRRMKKKADKADKFSITRGQ